MSRLIEIEDLGRIHPVGDPQISPDGRRVAYVVTDVDIKRKTYRSAIWVAATDGSESARFTGGKKKDSNPRWSPDGTKLAFLSDRDGKNQLYVMPSDGGEATRLTDLKNGASDPVWSADGTAIAFTSKIDPEGMILLSEQTDEDRKREAEKSDVRVIRTLRYKFDGEGFLGDARRHILVVSAEGGRPRQITDGDWNDSQPAWSPEGREIAFVSNRTEDRERNTRADIWVAPLDGGEPHQVTASDGVYGNPAYSPDGKWLAFTGNPIDEPYGPTALTRLWLAGRPNGEPRNVTGEFDRAIGVMGQRPLWASDSSAIYDLVGDRGTTKLTRIGLDGEVSTLVAGEREMGGFSVANDGTLTFLASGPNLPHEVFVAASDGSDEHEVSRANADLLQELRLGTTEHFTYMGEGNVEIDGWLLKPPGFNPEVKYPLVLEIHGGPQGMYGYAFNHEFQLLAARGYVVVFTNPRGSTGQGQEFVSAALGDWGGIDYRDIMAGVDHVIGMGFIDEARQGVIGGSYGGYMTNWIVGHTGRFKVAVTLRSTCNRLNHFGTGDVAWSGGRWQFGTTPYDNPEIYMEKSPLSYVKNVTAPMLILASENDLRCPIEQSEQWFTALTLLGKTAKFVRFPNESHGLSRGGRPDHRVERFEHILGWFAEYL